MPEPTRDPRLLTAKRRAEIGVLLDAAEREVAKFGRFAVPMKVAYADDVSALLAHIAAQDQGHAALVEAAKEIVAAVKNHPDFSDTTLTADYGYDDDIKWAALRKMAAALATLRKQVEEGELAQSTFEPECEPVHLPTIERIRRIQGKKGPQP